jgi:hypothetical protein
MIHSVCEILTTKLNSYFRSRFAQTENIVLLSNLINQDGNAAFTEENRIVTSLLNIEQESAAGSPRKIGGGIAQPQINRPLYLNLNILFSVHFSGKNYPDGLKFFSALVAYFQANTLIDRQNTPDLDRNIDKLTIEMVDVPIETWSNLWSMIGAKQVPAVLYKLRMLTFQEGLVIGELPLIKEQNL